MAIASSGRYRWYRLNELVSRVAKVTDALDSTRISVADQLARDMEEYAQRNAPWEDRTGDARSGLTGSVDSVRAKSSRAILRHTVSYGKHLETMQGGRFQIIAPTINHFAQELRDRLSESSPLKR